MLSRCFDTSETAALRMDQEDLLGNFRERFYVRPDRIYMDGNSLGLASKDAEATLLRVVEEWKTLGIDGWMGGKIPWFYYPETLAKLQAPLVGAAEDEVLVHSSTTVNLHAMISTFYKPSGKRNKLMMDELTFPSDRYAVESQIRLLGLDPQDVLVVVKSKDGRTIDQEEIVRQMSDEIALILLPSVLYRSGQLFDIKYLTAEAHKQGIIIGYDCCHSVGAVPHKFSEWGVDFAFWCNYKYLNNGPGGTASLYVNRKYFGRMPGMTGWFSSRKDKQFDLANELEPAFGAGAWQIGTPHMFSMAPLEGSLKMFQEAGLDRLREKSLHMTSYLMYLIDTELTPYGFRVGNPREDHRRGGHVALEHDDAIRINSAIKDRGIVPDFRYPDVIRLAPIALYNTYHELWRMIQIIKAIMVNKEYEKFSSQRGAVS